MSMIPVKSNKFIQRSLFISMLISNVILLLLPITIGFVLYTKTEQTIKSNAERSNTAMLEQMKLSLDSRFKEIQQLSQQIVLNPKLNYLLEAGNKDSEQLYNIVQFMWDYMKTYQSISTGFVEDFYVYMNKSDTVTKPNMVTDSYMFYDKYYRFQGQSYEEWINQLNTHKSLTYGPSRILLRHGPFQAPSNVLNDSSLRVVTFQQSLPVHESTDIKGSLVVLIDERKIQEVTRQLENGNGSSVYIVNRNYETISASAGAVSLPEDLLSHLNAESGMFHYQLNGLHTTVSFATSEQVGWYYISVMPSDLYMQKVKQFEQLAMWLFFLCIVLGAIVAYWMAYRNYFPIKWMVYAVGSGLRYPRKRTYNELEFIMEQMELSRNGEKQVKDKLFQQIPMIRANYLHRMIQGYIEPPEQMEKSLDFMNVHFSYPNFVIVLVQIESSSPFLLDHSEKQWALARFSISNLAEDLTPPLHSTYLVELGQNRLAFLMNLDTEVLSHSAAGITGMVSELNRILSNRFKLNTTFSVSGVHKGYLQIAEAFLEATATAEYQQMISLHSICYFEEIHQKSLQYHYPLETEMQLINYVRTGDTEQVANLLQGLFKHNLREEALTPELTRYLIISLSGTLLRVVNTDTPVYRKLIDMDFQPARTLFSCKTSEEMLEKTLDMYQTVTDAFKSEQHGAGQLLLKIESFIDNHYADPNMSLTMISDYIEMTPQYVSQVYKKISGRNLSDYLAQVRIDQAKQLMANSRLTNDQIAKMIGYTNDTVFIRVFKRLEGITPGKYREKYKNVI